MSVTWATLAHYHRTTFKHLSRNQIRESVTDLDTEPRKPWGHVGFRRKPYLSRLLPVSLPHTPAPPHRISRCWTLARPGLTHACLHSVSVYRLSRSPRTLSPHSDVQSRAHTRFPTPRLSIPDLPNPPTPRQSRALRANPISSRFRRRRSRGVSHTSEVMWPRSVFCRCRSNRRWTERDTQPNTNFCSAGAWILTNNRTAPDIGGSILHCGHGGQRRIITTWTV